jgi:RNase adapter protein RapZ
MEKRQIWAISGVSGAGKSTMAKALEDLGFFVVDNLPAELLGRAISLIDEFNEKAKKLAFIMDVRELNLLDKFPQTWSNLKKQKKNNYEMRLFFLDCSDDTIVRRYKETRRRHPLERDQGVRDGIVQERKLLNKIRNLADNIIVTDTLSVHSLKKLTQQRFCASENKILITLLSFGFKHGLPPELDLCFDVRFLKNPYFVESLRPLSGEDEKVREFILSSPHAKDFLKKVADLLMFLVPLYQKESKSYMTVAIGCTGGRHRSPTLALELKEKLKLKNVTLRVEHRDINLAQV